MTVAEVQAQISRETGIPEYKLPGQSPMEVIQRARIILDQQRAKETAAAHDTRDQFAEWVYARQGYDPQAAYEAAHAAIDRVAEALRTEGIIYPEVRDGGSGGVHLGDCRSAADQFGDFVSDQLAFDPRTDADGWTHLGPLP